MAAKAAEVIAIMREVGIEKDIVDQIKADVPLVDQGLDSVDLPMLAFAAEKKFGVSFSEVDPKVLSTINAIIAFVNESKK